MQNNSRTYMNMKHGTHRKEDPEDANDHQDMIVEGF